MNWKNILYVPLFLVGSSLSYASNIQVTFSGQYTGSVTYQTQDDFGSSGLWTTDALLKFTYNTDSIQSQTTMYGETFFAAPIVTASFAIGELPCIFSSCTSPVFEGTGLSSPHPLSVANLFIEAYPNSHQGVLTNRYPGEPINLAFGFVDPSFSLSGPFLDHYGAISGDFDIFRDANALFYTFQGRNPDRNFGSLTATFTSLDPTPNPVPEPATLALIGLPLVGFGVLKFRTRFSRQSMSSTSGPLA